MSRTAAVASIRHLDRFFIGGQWTKPAGSKHFDAIDSGTESVYARVPEATRADVEEAVAAARAAFDHGPWPRMSHTERAGYLRALGAALGARAGDLAAIWTMESGILHSASLPYSSALGGVYE